MKTLVWTGLVLLVVFAACALGAAAMLGLPTTGAGFTIAVVLLAATGIALIATRPQAP